jgi:glutamate-1-semialdehyde 2,1-aminomutase
MERTKALEKTFRAGQMLKDGLEAQAKALGLDICYSGPVTIPFMTFKDDPDFIKAKTFCAAAYQEGVFFHPYHNWFVSAAHTDADIRETLAVTEKAFRAVKEA